VHETVLTGDGPGAYRRHTYEVDPRALGLAPAQLSDLQGGPPELNAELAAAVLAGELGLRREFVLLNAGAALIVAGLAADLACGIELAASVLDSGAAGATLAALVTASRRAATDGLV
jgi:anthranilate phosphoribosyltransferase